MLYCKCFTITKSISSSLTQQKVTQKQRINYAFLDDNLMCNCQNVQFYEVDFKLAGMQVVPSHKNCGDALSEDQNSKFEKELLKYWGFENKPH